ncbi:HlyD family secretion protein [Chloroflexota bacterium]
MKRRGTIGMLLLGLILITATSCSGGAKETTNQQSAEKVPVTADGNIKASLLMGLTFGSGGKVDKIYFKEGDKVNKDDVLARLETDSLELAVTQAEVAVTQAEVHVVQAEVAVTQAEVAVTQAETGLKSADLELKNAQDLYIEADVVTARQVVTAAKANLEYAKDKLEREAVRTYDILFWTRQVEASEDKLRAAEAHLANLLSIPDPEEVAIKRLQVASANQSLALNHQSLELAQQYLTQAQQSLRLAQQSLKQVQKQLDEATITAPFDGTVYKVGVKEGEFLSPASFTERTIVGIVDLSHMELIARVDELDIAKVKTGQKVIISIDAVPETKLEGRVTFISPVARELGVVLFEDENEEKEYEVKVDFDIPGNLPILAGMSATAEIIVE